MTENEFRKQAIEFGYSREDIEDFVDFAKKNNIPYEFLGIIPQPRDIYPRGDIKE